MQLQAYNLQQVATLPNTPTLPSTESRAHNDN
jgi:hypothetical protein